MKLHELDAVLVKQGRVSTSVPKEVVNPIAIADAIIRGRSATYIEPQHGLMIVRREPQERLPGDVVQVEVDGMTQYMRYSADGHLGALDE